MWLTLAALTLLALCYASVAAVGVPAMALPSGDTLKTLGAVLGGVAAVGTLVLAALGKLGASVMWLFNIRTRRLTLDDQQIQIRERQIVGLLATVDRLETENATGVAERAAMRVAFDALQEKVTTLQDARIVDINANKEALLRLASEKDNAHAAQLNAARLEHEATLRIVRAEFAAKIEDCEEESEGLRKQLREREREVAGLRADLRRRAASERTPAKKPRETGPID